MGNKLERKRISRRTLLRGVCMGVVLSTGLLLWARLKIVTSTPRMVYAEPDATPADKSNAGNAVMTPPVARFSEP